MEQYKIILDDTTVSQLKELCNLLNTSSMSEIINLCLAKGLIEVLGEAKQNFAQIE